MKLFKRKGISPLISWVLMVGMMITIGTMVSLFLMRQAEQTTETFEESQYQKLYCPDVSLDGTGLCYETLQGNNAILQLTLKNRGTFTIRDVIITVKNTNRLETLKNVENGDTRYNFPLSSISPGASGTLRFTAEILGTAPVSPETIITDHGLEEISIIPSINIEEKDIVCNQKIFKLKTMGEDIPSC